MTRQVVVDGWSWIRVPPRGTYAITVTVKFLTNPPNPPTTLAAGTNPPVAVTMVPFEP